MIFFVKALLGLKKGVVSEQHITNLSVARLTNLSYNEDFSEIFVESILGTTSSGYVYIYLDNTSSYIPYCYDDLQTKLNLYGNVGGARYGIAIDLTKYSAGTHVFSGGIKEIATGKVVQRFKIIYTKNEE